MGYPIAIISNDWHIKRDNSNAIIKAINLKCQLALQYNLKAIICLGDVFDSRISQRMDVLNSFYCILETCKKYHIQLICIPGNHDKTDYEIEESFLRAFNYHPNLLLIENYKMIKVDNYHFHFIPYFNEDKCYKNYLDQIEYHGNDVLLSHIALQGSRTNDNIVMNNTLKSNLFGKFRTVLLGHYHNQHSINSKIHHLPSLLQNNFSEDHLKGFTLLYDDLSYQIISSQGKEYHSIDVDLSNINLKSLDKILDDCDCKLNHYRLIFYGSKEQISSIDLSNFKVKGFTIQTINKSIKEKISIIQNTSLEIYNKEFLMKLFDTFCQQKQINIHTGSKYFNAMFKNEFN